MADFNRLDLAVGKLEVDVDAYIAAVGDAVNSPVDQAKVDAFAGRVEAADQKLVDAKASLPVA